MRINEGFSLIRKDGQNVIVAKDGNAALDAAITLSETSAFLWGLCQNNDVTKQDMLNALLNNFEMSTVLALNNIDVFVKTMREYGILSE